MNLTLLLYELKSKLFENFTLIPISTKTICVHKSHYFIYFSDANNNEINFKTNLGFF